MEICCLFNVCVLFSTLVSKKCFFSLLYEQIKLKVVAQMIHVDTGRTEPGGRQKHTLFPQCCGTDEQL